MFCGCCEEFAFSYANAQKMWSSSDKGEVRLINMWGAI